MRRVAALGLPLDLATMDEAVAALAALARGGEGAPRGGFPAPPPPAAEAGPAKVYFLNAHCANVAARDPAYREALRRADYVFADGAGVRLAGLYAGEPVPENVNGTDLFPLLMERLVAQGSRVFFVGARRRVVAALVERALERWPGLRITGFTVGYFPDDGEVLAALREFGADVLFVAMGVPRQELWIDRNSEGLPCRLALAVGGLFDFYSGFMPRAPLWMRRLGLEWAFRLAMEPGRMWRRYLLGNLVFLARVVAAGRRGRRIR